MNKNKLKMNRKLIKKMSNEEITLLLIDIIESHNNFVDSTIEKVKELDIKIENHCTCITDIRLRR